MSTELTINVKNFGPIASAGVDLRPLTVFIGPSNTGKSYLAGLLYAVHRSLAAPAWHGPYFLQTSRLDFGHVERLSEDLKKELDAWIAATSSLAEDEDVTVPSPLAAHIHRMLSESRTFGASLTSQVARCFGVEDTTELVRQGSRSGSATLDVVVPRGGREVARFHATIGSSDDSLEVDIDLSQAKFKGGAVRRIVDSTRLYTESSRGGDSHAQTLDAELVVRELAESVFRHAFAPLVWRSAYYLPADRTGVMHSHHVVVSALVQRASLAGIQRFDDVPMLSGVMADFLNLLVSHISQLERRPARSATIRKLAQEIESRVLNGHIRVNVGEVRYPSFGYRPNGWKRDLPLMRASSMVSELAPVVLYLRHVVEPGDLLIIEEPESHLHPSKQAAFARELALIVNAGVRVVMTTHSEWFLEQIGNLVRASALPPDKRPGIEEALDPEDVGAWLFDPRTRGHGSHVTEVKLDPETGLYPTDYGPVSDALYNEHATIFDLLQGDVDDQ